jgi:hypothetical protein
MIKERKDAAYWSLDVNSTIYFHDRKTRPKMTLSVFFKILALGLLEYVHHHNFLYGLSVYSLHLFNNYTNM